MKVRGYLKDWSESHSRHLTMSLLELKFGKVLGVGSFGIVCEITHITLLDGDPTMQSIIENATEFFSESFGFIDEDAQDDYDLDMARKKVATHCIRQGEARYAVKCVRGDLDEVLEARARIDFEIVFCLFIDIFYRYLVMLWVFL